MYFRPCVKHAAAAKEEAERRDGAGDRVRADVGLGLIWSKVFARRRIGRTAEEDGEVLNPTDVIALVKVGKTPRTSMPASLSHLLQLVSADRPALRPRAQRFPAEADSFSS